MSDPVSNSEIEDVLASIRRLVSENAKALKGDRSRDPEAEKLVLTPAHRIDESEAAAQDTDVFAVDTETWNEVADRAEDTENKGMFSHRPQNPVTTSEPEASNADAGAEATEASTGDPLAADTGVADAVSATDSGDSATQDPASPTTMAADAPAETPEKTDLEQQIAELESAMDLRAEPTAAEEDAGQGEAPAEEAAAPKPEAPTAPSSDAPPRSWIEGLVAAAAAAEATRLSKSAQPAAEPPEDTAVEDAGETAATEEPQPEPVEAEAQLDDASADDADGGVETEEAARPEPFELTAAHAAPVDDTVEDAQADEAPVAEVDATFVADEDQSDADAVETPDSPAEPVEAVTDDAESAPQEAGPERSWVDKLIAAAATLKATPLPEAEAGADAGTAEAELVDEAGGEPEPTDAVADAAEDDPVSEAAASLTPLSLNDPIEPEAAEHSAVPDWEEVDPPEEAAEDDAPVAAEVDEDPIVDIDTVLTGPWTADAAEDTAENAEQDSETVGEAADEVPGATDDTSGPEEVAVGALEWEPVETPEADEDVSRAEEAAAEDAPRDADTDESDAGDLQWETVTTDTDPDADPDVEPVAEPDVAAEDDLTGEAAQAATEDDDYDADSAAVAAAVEADDDWSDAAGADVSDLGMAAAAATGLAAAGSDRAVISEEETVFDEAMLREMVAQIVRDELQGTVGERITHNVRRLIRREIARALTLQDFEK